MKTSNSIKIYEEKDFVIHFNDSLSSFSLLQEGIEVGTIETRINGNQIWLNHVYIDPKLRGKKLGEVLVLSAVSYLKQVKFEVIPVCSYARAIMARKLRTDGDPK